MDGQFAGLMGMAIVGCAGHERREECITKRVKFTPEEDAKLVTIVKQNGPKQWRCIAANLPGRTARQCRDRFNNYLLPYIDNAEWTTEEDKILFEKYAMYGPRWSFIKKFFNKRSSNNIKNRWHVHLSKNYSSDQTVSNESTNSAEEEKDDSSSEVHTPRPIIIKKAKIHRIGTTISHEVLDAPRKIVSSNLIDLLI